MPNPQIKIVFEAGLFEALREFAYAERIPISRIIRTAVFDLLTANGVEVEAKPIIQYERKRKEPTKCLTKS